VEDQEEYEQPYRPGQRIGLVGGAVGFLLLLMVPGPEALPVEGWRTAAVAFLMATWWMTEAIPIPATAILPLVLFPALGILTAPDASAPYANQLIFLFMGGFFIAVTMERWGLHKRIALGILARVGSGPHQLVLGFMLATAFLSMCMLGIAYAASIGGSATLIGTPPNAVLAGAASEMLGVEIGFVQWMGVGVPVVIVMLPITWLLLTRVLYRPGKLSGDAEGIIETERSELGPMSAGERVTAAVFTLTALAWILRSEKTFGGLTVPGLESLTPLVTDSTIAMAAAALLFILPVSWSRGQFALDWATARKIPWGVLVLFGGGLSLARAMDQSGLAVWIGGAVGALDAVPVLVLIAFTALMVIFLTELTSNTATSTMAMPIMVGAAAGLGIEPLLLMAAAGLAAAMAFMLPVATPPNAIVFASGYITIPQMAKAGLFLNLLGVLVISVLGSLLIPIFLVG
jgi:sodium-dependent dicarboxylate transporter 2/3/5